MKKFLLTTAFMALGIIAAMASTKELSYSVVAIYDEAGYDVPNYYVILSDSENAKYVVYKSSDMKPTYAADSKNAIHAFKITNSKSYISIGNERVPAVEMICIL